MRTATVRTVLFDAGNTLLHLDHAFVAAVLAEHAHPVTAAQVRLAEYAARAAIDRALAPAARSRPEALVWPDGAHGRPSYFGVALADLGVPAALAEPMIAALRDHHQATNLWRVVEPDTVAVLTTLRERGYTLGVVSNADGRVADDLERAGLRGLFVTVIDSHVVGVEKPDPRIFALALAEVGAAPASALYVGDVFGIDVQGARAAGLDAILIDALGCYPGDVDCRRIARLADLLPILPPLPRAG